MKLLKTDRGEGYAKIRIENEDDLWYLKDIIAKGDEVKAFTQRTKLDGREKKACTLSLEVEKTEYQENRLRVTGEILEGAEDIELGFHTFNLEPEQEFEVWKEFTQEEWWARLEEAEEKRSYKVFFALIEKGGADFYIVEESGIKDLSNVEENIPGKMYSSDKDSDKFYDQVKEIIERSADDMDYIILCGPGNQKNKVKNQLSDEVLEKTMLQDTSVTGRTGLHEAIKRGALKKVVESSRISEESEVIEKFLERLNEEDRVSYGEEPVRDLIEQGAVEKLIITAEKHRRSPELARKVEQMGGEVSIVHADHEAGERLENFGGVGALLRYEI